MSELPEIQTHLSSYACPHYLRVSKRNYKRSRKSRHSYFPIMRLLGCFSDAKGQQTQLSMVRFDRISNSFEMSCMSSENDWLKKKKKKNTEKRSRHRFLHYRVLTDLSQNLVQPSPHLTLHTINPQVSEIFLFESVDKRHTHIQTDGRRLVSYHIGFPCHHSDPVSKKSSKQGLQRFS